MVTEWPDVLDRIKAGESEVTEFRRGADNLPAIAKTICAFANGRGGLLIIGVDDVGTIVGEKANPDRVHDWLCNILDAGCGHTVSAYLDRYESGSRWVHWVHVGRHHRGHGPFSYGGRFWIRRGRATAPPSESDLLDLFIAFGLVITERQTVSTATVADIDLTAFRSFMRAQAMEPDLDPQPDIEDDLRNASACRMVDDTLRPTLYGLMVFGKEPQGFPHTISMHILCAAYAGTDRASDELSVGESRGQLHEQADRAVGWFKSLGHRVSYEGPYRQDHHFIPLNVLREALVNAVIHRDYAVVGSHVMLEVFSDRVDVTSPGTLPNHMTVAEACGGGTPHSRNEFMANAMVVRRQMERRGRGWLMMRRAMREFNGTEPEMINSTGGRYVRVTFRLKQEDW